ncbi:alpha/beta hydrolase [Streptomyces sp. 147326]|uniref:alpha/beta hydrolase n=1 Tax=Streptomyces sp. 147326 TaxID=3074379 RepID=UPI003857BB03
MPRPGPCRHGGSSGPTDGLFEVDELVVPGAPGDPDVTLVSARPAGVAGPLPALYYLHGGGMIMGNARSVVPQVLRAWALPLELAVVSVEYRLAPHTRYPGPVEDCYAGLVRVAEHAPELGIDADRVVIGGKSAGGGLAAAPARATDLSGLPPAYIEVGSAETFRDEAVAYANAIWQAGGQAELHVWPGAFPHGFDTFAPRAALSRDARAARSAWLGRVLARSGAGPADC